METLSESSRPYHRPFNGSPLADPEERHVIFAALDSFRYLLVNRKDEVTASQFRICERIRYTPIPCIRTLGVEHLSQYRRNSHYNITHRRRQNLYALPQRQRELLVAPPFNLLDTFDAIDDAIDHNADIAEAILELGLRAFELPAEPGKDSEADWHGTAQPGDMAKVHSTIRQFYRDWSAEGFESEVQPSLKMVLVDLAKHLGSPSGQAQAPLLLLPGAGLGRLLFSLSLEGYNVEGNEISYHQLLASNFILNTTKEAHQYRLYPFAGTFTNHKARSNQLREVRIPDIHPATAVTQPLSTGKPAAVPVGQMNMTAGDFLTCYGDADSKNSFDAVVSVYFIDTAPNLIRYIETVWNCLKDQGIWINIGPLLWHFDDRRVESQHGHGNASRSSKNEDLGIAESGSFELTDEEVLSLLISMGFEVLEHDYLAAQHGGYIQDEESMVQNRYVCSHWVARRPSR